MYTPVHTHMYIHEYYHRIWKMTFLSRSPNIFNFKECLWPLLLEVPTPLHAGVWYAALQVAECLFFVSCNSIQIWQRYKVQYHSFPPLTCFCKSSLAACPSPWSSQHRLLITTKGTAAVDTALNIPLSHKKGKETSMPYSLNTALTCSNYCSSTQGSTQGSRILLLWKEGRRQPKKPWFHHLASLSIHHSSSTVIHCSFPSLNSSVSFHPSSSPGPAAHWRNSLLHLSLLAETPKEVKLC